MHHRQLRFLVCAAIVGALILIGGVLSAQEGRPPGSRIETVYDVDLDELAERLPREPMLYTTKPDPVAASQQEALEAALEQPPAPLWQDGGDSASEKAPVGGFTSGED